VLTRLIDAVLRVIRK